MAKPAPITPVPVTTGERTRSFLLWAFAISIVGHFVFGSLLPYKPYQSTEEKEQKVSVTKKIKVVVPTPRPTPTPPPPTPPPNATPPPVKSTNPPPQAKLKLNVPKTSNKGDTSSAEKQYVAPQRGSENGVPNGNVASAPPAPPSTAAPATGPPPPPPTPQRPTCASPHQDAKTTQKAEADYPEMARQQGAVGTATVKVSLSATGGVNNVSIFKSAGNQSLDQEALKAARNSRYAPEVEDCQKTAGVYLFVVEFTSQ
ncbi:MAG: energy transducer TonB [Candidatus Eremiobacteraeota bacterium]|nr:energy transducer TonB [Candidatus Eremiobacteraeota bacterium]